MANLLSQKAVVADVVIRRWTGRKLDKAITDQVNEQHAASADAGRYNKLLIPREAFGDIHQLTSAARHKHYLMTLPWSDAGFRILPSVMYDDFAKTFRTYKTDFDKAADAFTKAYPGFVTGAKARLKSMFKAEHYPEHSRVRGMFSFSVSIRPCPDVEDFRVSLAKEHAEDIKSNLEKEMQGALREAMQEPVRRIIDVVGKMSGKLKEYKPATETSRAENTFRDSLVTNIQELLPLLGAFNLTEDKTLAKLITRMEKELCAHDGDALREDEKTRKAVAKAAEDILKQANALMA